MLPDNSFAFAFGIIKLIPASMTKNTAAIQRNAYACRYMVSRVWQVHCAIQIIYDYINADGKPEIQLLQVIEYHFGDNQLPNRDIPNTSGQSVFRSQFKILIVCTS